MSVSPPIYRYSSTSSSSREDLSTSTRRRKSASSTSSHESSSGCVSFVAARSKSLTFSQLREEKIALENTLEAESESHVNRLSREISVLRLAQQQQAQVNGNGSGSISPVDTRFGIQTFLGYRNPTEPNTEMMLEAMRRENEQLRTRLVDTERDYIRITRLNEIYREELIEHRRRLGLPVDNLIGLASPDPYSQPTHHRTSSSASSPSTSIPISPSPQRLQSARPTPVPIPRPPSQIHRPVNAISEANTPLSHSPSSVSSSSPFPLSPPSASPMPTSYASAHTNVTTPPSSASLTSNPPAPYPGAATTLSYPSVPPPSLSSSFGSPSTMYHINTMYPRRDSIDRRVAESGTFSRSQSQGHSRRASVERGARIAETGSLLPRGRTTREQSVQESPEETNGETSSSSNGGTVRPPNGHS
ncbi:uncharacterized protein B0H18DRAFT_987067 [Fomitopsis serialis]|uniref:uncharacterized protein n=1 Tax=Fomitopsis serialis TaxID=139415 RepID=UPI002007DD6C|nr:uncharacterized protein B0H18DRAFT_987067 [Neoantrodia serialis]KAH9932209.1 hypothetical protein B0H18DRAFT_987067 [Neoantrodia serialis]